MRSCGRINIERFFGEVFSTSYILTVSTFTLLQGLKIGTQLTNFCFKFGLNLADMV